MEMAANACQDGNRGLDPPPGGSGERILGQGTGDSRRTTHTLHLQLGRATTVDDKSTPRQSPHHQIHHRRNGGRRLPTTYITQLGRATTADERLDTTPIATSPPPTQ